MTAQEASKLTGLDARIVERPNGDTVDFKPSERLMSVGDALRCQLGKRVKETHTFTMRDRDNPYPRTVQVIADVFILKSYGPTFEVAVSRLRAKKNGPTPLAAEQGANGIAALMRAPTPVEQ